MDRRRTRNAPKRYDETTSGRTSATATAGRGSSSSQASTTSTLRLSPTRTRASPPVRRSSRPRSTTSTATVTITPAMPPSPIMEVKEPKSSPKQQRHVGGIATSSLKTAPVSVSNASTTAATASATSIANANTRTTSTTTTVHSSYESTTTTTMKKTLQLNEGGIASEISKFSEFLRRSVSIPLGRSGSDSRNGSHTPTTHTEDAETNSRYSRSASRSVYSKAEFSDNENESEKHDMADVQNDDEFNGTEIEEPFRSFSYNTKSRPPTSVAHTSEPLCRKLAVPQEFGGRWGVLLLLLLAPSMVYYLQWCCDASNNALCTLRVPPLRSLKSLLPLLQSLFPLPAVAAYVAMLFVVFIASAVLPGKYVRLPQGRGNIEYKFNAPAMTVLLSIALAVLQHRANYAVDFALEHYMHFCLYGLLNSYVVALWAYIRSGNWLKQKLRAADVDLLLNEYAKTDDRLLDYAQGRHINPKWLGVVELKLVFRRFAWLSVVLYAQCYFYRALRWPSGSGDLLGALVDVVVNTPTPWKCAQQVWLLLVQFTAGVQYDGAALLSAAMLLLYAGDSLLFEHHLGSSFEMQGEGFGALLLMRYAATPYLLSGVARYYNYQQPNAAIACQWAVYGPLVLLVVGLTLKRFSNAIKYQYRLKPLLPIFADMETIHTFQGRRLLLGALWGRLRQPNYAGDILALVALALPLALRFVWPPLLGLLLVVILLLHRATRVNARNWACYQSSWGRYCTQVRNYIVPKIY